MPECDARAADVFAERLRKAVGDINFTLGGEARHITISIGIAALSPTRDARPLLMDAADAALYRAKDEGRNCVRIET